MNALFYSQLRKAALNCSDMEDRKTHIIRMEKKFLDSGFKQKDKQKALELSRNELLISKEKRDDEEVITCVINQGPGLRKGLFSRLQSPARTQEGSWIC